MTIEQWAQERLLLSGVDAQTAPPFASIFEDFDDSMDSPPGVDAPAVDKGDSLVIESAGIVIRDDDLKLLDCLADGAKSGVVFAFFAGAQSKELVGAGVGIVVAAAKAIRQLARKTAKLSKAQMRLLLILKSNDGLTVQELLSIRQRTDQDSTLEDLRETLSELQKIVLRDGQVACFASRDAREKWFSAGV